MPHHLRSYAALAFSCSLFALEGCDSKPTAPAPAEAEPKAEAAPVSKPALPPTAARAQTWTFDNDPVGKAASGFTLTETGPAGTPARWEIITDDTAPTPPRAFAIVESTNKKPTYNLALANDTRYLDVDISVAVKAGSGVLDQGGGPVWRVQDADNYYIARWNPLENNARFYVVVSGVRSALGKVELDLDASAWHTLRVVAEGKHMELFIDDEPVLAVDDDTHQKAGQVGLWTKADAATSFDDLSVVAVTGP